MRVVALGASNLTRGFHTIVSTARSEWGRDVDVLAALGHGRSYGGPSRLVVRTLPGILQSGLWRQLSELPSAPTRALLTDIGNDVVYGHSAAQTLAWVEETIYRLQRFTNDIVLTDLPVANVRRLSPTMFLVFRSVLVPECRMSQRQVVAGLERVNDGVLELATAHQVRLLPLRPEWYGVDPIHIRRSQWRPAWQEILCGEPRTSVHRSSRLEGLRLYYLRPERQWLFGREFIAPQTGLHLPAGGRVWLY
jgi:hypothetical protein